MVTSDGPRDAFFQVAFHDEKVKVKTGENAKPTLVTADDVKIKRTAAVIKIGKVGKSDHKENKKKGKKASGAKASNSACGGKNGLYRPVVEAATVSKKNSKGLEQKNGKILKNVKDVKSEGLKKAKKTSNAMNKKYGTKKAMTEMSVNGDEQKELECGVKYSEQRVKAAKQQSVIISEARSKKKELGLAKKLGKRKMLTDQVGNRKSQDCEGSDSASTISAIDWRWGDNDADKLTGTPSDLPPIPRIPERERQNVTVLRKTIIPEP